MQWHKLHPSLVALAAEAGNGRSSRKTNNSIIISTGRHGLVRVCFLSLEEGQMQHKRNEKF